MHIVVLDGYTLNPGDLNWAELQSLGTCEIYERSAPHEVVPRARDAGMVLTNKVDLQRDVLEQLPNLRYIGVLATGTNVVDLKFALERGVVVTNVPAYGTKSVAQTTMALLLELTHHVGHHAQTVRESRWVNSLDWCYWERPLIELDGLTLGIVGYGRIGRAVGELAAAFGMKIIAHTPTPKPAEGVRFVSLEELLRESDVVTLHCPLTPATEGLVNGQRLSWMKPGAFLLNAGRGQLIEEQALAAALNSGQIAGAALDVLSSEPPRADNPLLRAKNCYITPHLAWATQAARARLLRIAIENIRGFLNERPRNVVK